MFEKFTIWPPKSWLSFTVIKRKKILKIQTFFFFFFFQIYTLRMFELDYFWSKLLQLLQGNGIFRISYEVTVRRMNCLPDPPEPRVPGILLRI